VERTPSLTLGQRLYDEGRLADAEEAFRRAIAEEPGNPDGHLWLWRLLRDEARLAHARAALQKGLALREDEPALVIVGAIQHDLGDLDAAEQSFRRALELDPSNDETYFGLGRLALARSDWSAAVEYLQEAVRLDPSPGRRFELAKALFGLERMAETEAVVREAIADDPTDAWSSCLLGHVLYAREDWPGARDAFAQAVQHAPEVGLFWAELAEMSARLGFEDEADRLFREALARGPGDSILNRKYGIFLQWRGSKEKGRGYLKRALSLDPDDHQARRVLDRLDGAKRNAD
jgi:tetratricopeptide (TPR) repeat protein